MAYLYYIHINIQYIVKDKPVQVHGTTSLKDKIYLKVSQYPKDCAYLSDVRLRKQKQKLGESQRCFATRCPFWMHRCLMIKTYVGPLVVTKMIFITTMFLWSIFCIKNWKNVCENKRKYHLEVFKI